MEARFHASSKENEFSFDDLHDMSRQEFIRKYEQRFIDYWRRGAEAARPSPHPR